MLLLILSAIVAAAHASTTPVTMDDVQNILADWNLKSTFGEAFKKFEVDGDVFMDLQPTDFEQNALDFPNARDYHWRKLLRLRRDLFETETQRPARSLKSVAKKPMPPVDLKKYKGVIMENAPAKVSFGPSDDVALYYNEKGKLKLKGDLLIKGQSLQNLIKSTCQQVLKAAVDDGQIAGPAVGYVQTGTKTFTCTGKDQTFKVPEGVTKISVDLKGAAGGGSFAEGAKSPGGDGGRTKGSILVTPGQVLTIQVGCGGTYGFKKSDHPRPYPSGGLPGYRNGYYSGAGGGRSAIIVPKMGKFIGSKSVVVSREYALVAGGGGGAGGAGCGGKRTDGGNGGGNKGERGFCSYDWTAHAIQKKGCVTGGAYQNGGVGGTSDGKQGLKMRGADASQHHFSGNNKGNAAGGGGDGWYGGGAAGEFKGATGEANIVDGVKIQPHYHCGGGGGAGYVNPDLTVGGVTLQGGGGKGKVGGKGSPGSVTLTLFSSSAKSQKSDGLHMTYIGNGACADNNGKALTVGAYQPASKAKRGVALTKDKSCWGIGWNNLPNIKDRGATACEQCLNSVEGRSQFKGQQCVPVKPFKDGNGNIITCERPGTAAKLAKNNKCQTASKAPAPSCTKQCLGDDGCYGYVTDKDKSGNRVCALVKAKTDPDIQGVDGSKAKNCFVKAKTNKQATDPITTALKCEFKDQVFKVPKGVKFITAVLRGAGGGSSDAESRQAKGGDGGLTSGTFAVTPGQSIGVEVGCGGTSGQTKDKHKRAYPSGGLPGYRNGYSSGGGGGRTSIFTFVGKSLKKNYLLVAGGGGGSGGWGCGGSKTAKRNSDGGTGGGTAGTAGRCICGGTKPGKPGTQSGGGKKLQGSDAPQTQFGQSKCSGSVCNAAGGGGDGWYGGTHGQPHCGGGGGSGYINKAKMIKDLKPFTSVGGGGAGGRALSGGRPGSHGTATLTFHFIKPSKSCTKEFSFANCAQVKAHGCKDGEYKLKSCAPQNPSSCTNWRTRCEGGRTLIGYLAKTEKTKNRFDVYTKWPKQSPSRKKGSTFLFQGNLKQLALSKVVVYEGVKCSGSESFGNNCKWVHSTDTCDVSCLGHIVKSWGYNYNGNNAPNNKRPACAPGKVGGARKAGCAPYKTTSHTILGWAVDMHGTGNCWVARGSCCSNRGGTGACDKGDSNGQYHGMLWVQQA